MRSGVFTARAAKVAGIILVFGVLSTVLSSDSRAAADSNTPVQVQADQPQVQPADQPALVAEQSTEQSAKELSAQSSAKDPNQVSQPVNNDELNRELLMAVMQGQEERVKELISQGADINAKINGLRTILHIAVMSGNDKSVLLLFNNGALVDVRDENGLTPLHIAARAGFPRRARSTNMIKALLDKGADINAKDNNGLTPLHYAAGARLGRISINSWKPVGSNCNEEIVALLIKQSNINAQDRYGLTPLHFATVNNSAKVMLLLLNNGARFDVRDNAGRAPLHYATGAGPGFNLSDDWSIDIAKLILDRGANINVKDNIGWTPLHYLVQSRSKVGIEFLVERGADLDCTDNRGCTPYSWALAAFFYHESISSPRFRHSGADEFREIVELLRKIDKYNVIDSNSRGTNGDSSEISTKAISDKVCFVATNGQDTNPGTLDLPLRTLSTAISIAKPNDAIFVRGGVYHCSEAIYFTRSGELGKPIVIRAYARENPVFDFSDAKDDNSYGSLVITGAYWHLQGLTVTKAPHFGIRIYGSDAHHNVLEQIQATENVSTGIVLEKDTAYNTILNCDSSLNFDHNWNGEDACGFEVCWYVGQGNILIGNRAHNCSDNAYSLWMTGESVILEKCYSWDTIYNIWNHPLFTGNGRGITGGLEGKQIIIKCATWNHEFAGFMLNETRGLILRNCTAFNNTVNYYFPLSGWEKEGRKVTCIFNNNMSIEGTDGNIINPNVDSQHNSWDSDFGFVLTDNDFLSFDDSQMSAPRNPDGSIPYNNFLRLAPGSAAIDKGVDVGMPFVGARPDLGAFEYDPNETSEGYVKMLHQAVRDHDVKQIEQLLARGEGINDRDWLGYAPLHWAVYFGYADLIELLISKGADPDIESNTGRYALEIARAMAYPELEALLRKLGAKAGEVSTDESSQEAEAAEEQKKAEEKKASEEKKTEERQQTEEKKPTEENPALQAAIFAAAQSGDLEKVKAILAQGIDVDVKDAAGTTPLQLASLRGHEELVRLLISKGADINARRSDTGGTPLHNAVFAGHKEVVQLLIANGADLNVKNGRGFTPLDVAVRRGHAEIVEILTKAAEEQKKTEEKKAKEQEAGGENKKDEGKPTEEKETTKEKPSSESPDMPAGSPADMMPQEIMPPFFNLLFGNVISDDKLKTILWLRRLQGLPLPWLVGGLPGPALKSTTTR